MKSAQQFIAGVEAIDGLEVVGQPEMTVVAFKASRRQATRSAGSDGARAVRHVCKLGAGLHPLLSYATRRNPTSLPHTTHTLHPCPPSFQQRGHTTASSRTMHLH